MFPKKPMIDVTDSNLSAKTIIAKLSGCNKCFEYWQLCKVSL